VDQRDKSFIIIVFYQRKRIRLTCEQIGIGIAADTWEVRAKNKTLVFENNRPVVDRARLRHFPWTWKLIKGELHNQSLQEDIIEALEAHIRGKGRPPLYPV